MVWIFTAAEITQGEEKGKISSGDFPALRNRGLEVGWEGDEIIPEPYSVTWMAPRNYIWRMGLSISRFDV